MVKISKPKLLYCTIVCFDGSIDKPVIKEETTLVYAKYDESGKVTYFDAKTGCVIEFLRVSETPAEKNKWYILDSTPINVNLVDAKIDIKDVLNLLPTIEQYIDKQNKKSEESNLKTTENTEEFINKQLAKKFGPTPKDNEYILK